MKKMLHKIERGYHTETREVTMLAIAKGYAMVRRKGAFPYVAPLKELHPMPTIADIKKLRGIFK